MGKNKKSIHKEFTVEGVSTNDSTKICDAFCNYFIDYPRNIHGSVPISISHQLDQVEINERTMYFRNATETDIIEYIMRLNKKSGKNDVSVNSWLYAKISSPITWKNYSTSVLHRVSTLMFLKLLKLHQHIRKTPFITYQTTGQYLY